MPTVFLLCEDPAEEELIVLIFAVWLALLLGSIALLGAAYAPGTLAP